MIDYYPFFPKNIRLNLAASKKASICDGIGFRILYWCLYFSQIMNLHGGVVFSFSGYQNNFQSNFNNKGRGKSQQEGGGSSPNNQRRNNQGGGYNNQQNGINNGGGYGQQGNNGGYGQQNFQPNHHFQQQQNKQGNIIIYFLK